MNEKYRRKKLGKDYVQSSLGAGWAGPDACGGGYPPLGGVSPKGGSPGVPRGVPPGVGGGPGGGPKPPKRAFLTVFDQKRQKPLKRVKNDPFWAFLGVGGKKDLFAAWASPAMLFLGQNSVNQPLIKGRGTPPGYPLPPGGESPPKGGFSPPRGGIPPLSSGPAQPTPRLDWT